MERRRRFIQTGLAVFMVALALWFSVSGCGREDEPAAQQSTTDQMMGHAHDMAATADEAVLAGVEQKTCPVMEGNPINPNVFVEYEGKKVYFCCAGCPEQFKADPEKYLSKLPQFQQ